MRRGVYAAVHVDPPRCAAPEGRVSLPETARRRLMAKQLLLTALALVLGTLALYAVVIAWLWSRQESLLFFPEVLPAAHRLATEPDVHELRVEVPGAALSVLQLRLPDPKGVVFYLHGNGGSLAGWFSETALYRQANFDLVMMDYRGYGKSSGRIASEAQLRADVRAAWAAVAPRYAGRKVVVAGRSLGSGLAAGLAAELSAAGTPPAITILMSPYSSMGELMHEFYPWVPLALLRYRLDTAHDARQVRGPVLLIHAARDELIGPQHARRLQHHVPQARLHVIEGAGHNDLQSFGHYRQVMLDELGRL